MEKTLKKPGIRVEHSLSDLFAVVVLYKEEIINCTSLVSLQQSAAAMNAVLDVLIYDNSPVAQEKAGNISLFSTLNCIYFHDKSNPGVSKAYNYGASVADQLNKKFILLVDQDTKFPVESLTVYVDAINTHPKNHLFCPILQTKRGIYSPTKYYFRRGKIWAKASPGIHSLKNKNILNSGLLINLQAYLSIKGYNEKIELYFSDFDFVNRFRKVQNEMVVINLTCFHSLSDIDNVDLSSALRRFKHYVKGSYLSSQNALDYFYLFITIFLRACKLGWRYRTMDFLQLFFKQYVIEKFS